MLNTKREEHLLSPGLHFLFFKAISPSTLGKSSNSSSFHVGPLRNKVDIPQSKPKFAPMIVQININKPTSAKFGLGQKGILSPSHCGCLGSSAPASFKTWVIGDDFGLWRLNMALPKICLSGNVTSRICRSFFTFCYRNFFCLSRHSCIDLMDWKLARWSYNTMRWLVYIKFVYVYIDYHTTALLMSLTIVEICVRSTKSAFADKGLSDETISLWGWLGWEVRIYNTMNWAVNPGESPQVTHRWKFLPKMGRTTCSTQENDLNIVYIFCKSSHHHFARSTINNAAASLHPAASLQGLLICYFRLSQIGKTVWWNPQALSLAPMGMDDPGNMVFKINTRPEGPGTSLANLWCFVICPQINSVTCPKSALLEVLSGSHTRFCGGSLEIRI